MSGTGLTYDLLSMNVHIVLSGDYPVMRSRHGDRFRPGAVTVSRTAADVVVSVHGYRLTAANESTTRREHWEEALRVGDEMPGSWPKWLQKMLKASGWLGSFEPWPVKS